MGSVLRAFVLVGTGGAIGLLAAATWPPLAEASPLTSGAVVALSAAIVAAIVAAVDDAHGRSRASYVKALASVYRQGDFSRHLHERDRDPFGAATLELDELLHDLGKRTTDLERDRSRLEAILGGMVEGVLVVDQYGRIALANEAARVLLKLDESPIGRSYVELIRHPDVNRQVTQALEGGSPAGVELSLGTHAATVVTRAAAVPGRRGGGAVLVLHDISDLRRADRIRRDFVANVSHELRTPLTAIRGYVEALLDDPDGRPEARAFLEVIFRQASRMEQLVQDLLRLARLDAKQEALDTSPIGLSTLIATVTTDLAPTVANRRQRVVSVVDPPSLTVVADAAKLHDILRNLLENASNYSPEGTDITIEARQHDGSIWLTVSDEGPGVPESDLSRIFERFYRVDKARSRETGGTGLGLSIVRHLVELHGGDVWAANRGSQGATFTVRLPSVSSTHND